MSAHSFPRSILNCTKRGYKNTLFRFRVLGIVAFFSVYQSIVVYNFVISSSTESLTSSGMMFGQWDVSTMAFTCVVITVNLRLLMMCNRITKWHQLSIGGSILAWFLFIFVYSLFFTYKACCLYRQNKLKEAMESLKGLDGNYVTMLLESQILFRMGKMDASVDIYRKLQNSKIDSLEINFVVGLVSAGKSSEV